MTVLEITLNDTEIEKFLGKPIGAARGSEILAAIDQLKAIAIGAIVRSTGGDGDAQD